MATRKLLPIKAGLLRDQVRARIFEGIMEGRLRPGDPLREMNLARELRVSQATVREALLRLEPTGLVHRVPNKETTVTRLSKQDLRERKWVRLVLEPEAGVEAARRMQGADFDKLELLVGAIGKAVSKNAYFDLAQADLEFHRSIWRAANHLVFQVLDNLTAPMFAFVTLLRHGEHEELRDAVQAHEPILDALKQKQPARIRESIRQHIDRSYQEFLDSEWEDFSALALSRAKVAYRCRRDFISDGL